MMADGWPSWLNRCGTAGPRPRLAERESPALLVVWAYQLFYSLSRGPSYRVANDLRHCVLRRLTPPFVFLLFGISCPRQRSVGLEGAGEPVGFEPVAEKRDVILAPCSSASGLVTAVDSTMLMSSSLT